MFLINKIEVDVVYEGCLLCKELKIEDLWVCIDVILEFWNEVLIVVDKVFFDFIEFCGSLLGFLCVYVRDFGEFWNLIVFGNKLLVKFVFFLKVGFFIF